jgi:hypothetical protein
MPQERKPVMKTTGLVILVILIMSYPVTALGETWEMVFESEGLKVAVDIDSMQMEGSIVRYWERYIRKGRDISYSRYAENCEEGTSTYLLEWSDNYVVLHTLRDAGPLLWETPTPGTLIEKRHQFVCRRSVERMANR